MQNVPEFGSIQNMLDPQMAGKKIGAGGEVERTRTNIWQVGSQDVDLLNPISPKKEKVVITCNK